MAGDAEHLALIEKLYKGLDDHDGEAMASCYSDTAHFRDPAFGDLDADGVKAMWRMLCGRAEDLKVELAEHDADGDRGSAHWIATYTFSTGRHVVNDIQATFRFGPDGLIADHVDDFDFHRWAGQALGAPGKLLGWFPPFHAAVSRKARGDLEKFQAGDRAPA